MALNLEQIEEKQKKAEQKAKAREKKKKPKMAISGRSVFKMRELIRKKKP